MRPAASDEAPVLDVVAELRRRVDTLQGRPAAQPVPTHPCLEGLVGLRTGGIYGIDAASLALLLMAGPSAEGVWCGVVGVPDLGVEAAVAMGVDPARTILVPEPGRAWLEVTAALADVLGLVVVRPGGAVSAGDAARLSARLRQRGSVLVPWGPWPRCDVRLSVTDVHWDGVGQGHGHLRARRATVSARRGDAPARSRTLWMPAPDQSFRPVVAEDEVAGDAATVERGVG